MTRRAFAALAPGRSRQRAAEQEAGQDTDVAVRTVDDTEAAARQAALDELLDEIDAVLSEIKDPKRFLAEYVTANGQ
ncbi:hypothetical protein AB0D49_40690 [Streptomyces sp. NPDC048290]|uniref:hypothetical protein n=1 Tax=Streptomyces sp. NPDC048290 TaxID=3155811 RepID=UPI00341687A4